MLVRLSFCLSVVRDPSGEWRRHLPLRPPSPALFHCSLLMLLLQLASALTSRNTYSIKQCQGSRALMFVSKLLLNRLLSCL